MMVETDGSVRAEDAVALAARILQDNHQLRGAEEAGRRGAAPPRARLQRRALERGGRARAQRALGQLPEERQHRLHRRPHPEDRGGDAAHAELREQVSERVKEVLASMGLHLGMEVPNGRPTTSRSWPSASKGPVLSDLSLPPKVEAQDTPRHDGPAPPDTTTQGSSHATQEARPPLQP